MCFMIVLNTSWNIILIRKYFLKNYINRSILLTNYQNQLK